MIYDYIKKHLPKTKWKALEIYVNFDWIVRMFEKIFTEILFLDGFGEPMAKQDDKTLLNKMHCDNYCCKNKPWVVLKCGIKLKVLFEIRLTQFFAKIDTCLFISMPSTLRISMNRDWLIVASGRVKDKVIRAEKKLRSERFACF